MQRVDRRVLIVALAGLAASIATAGLGWYGIHLMVTVGPPVRAAAWKPYIPIIVGIPASIVVIYACFRLLNRMGRGPSLT